MERGRGRIRLSVIKDAATKSLRAFIESNIESGSELITDGWKSYKNMVLLGLLWVNKSYFFLNLSRKKVI